MFGGANRQRKERGHVRPTSDLIVRTIARLAPCEPWRAQCFHAGVLWEGHCGDPGEHRLDVHLPGSARVLAAARLRHTVEFLHPFGPAAVIAVGKHHHPRGGWRTFHSVARFTGTRLQVHTYTMPSCLQVEQFGGTPAAMFFNEPGSRQVYRWNGWWARPLGPEIHLPGTMILVGRSLYVLERNVIVPGTENLVCIDLDRGAATRTFPAPRRWLRSPVDLPDSPWLAVAETLAERVLVIDKRANRLARSIPVPGGPVALAPAGRCLAVLADDPLRLLFLDRDDGFGVAAVWDLGALGAAAGNVTALAVDAATATAYLRSPFHPTVADNDPTVTMVADPGGETLRRCVGRGVVV